MKLKERTKKGNKTMKTFLASTVAASALALVLGMTSARAEDTIDSNAKQGGEIIATYKDDVTTLDPAIGYDWQNWSMIKSLFDGLMDYEPGTTNLKPDLAESYDRFARRQDLHLQAAPRRQIPQWPRDDGSRRQVFARPRHQSEDAEPRCGLLRFDQGLRRCRGRQGRRSLGGHRCRSLHREDRIEPAGRHLPACHGDQLLHVVPKEEVEKYGADFGKHPVGTGAFKLAEWTLGQRIVFERNADYWRQGSAAYRQDHIRGRPGADRGACCACRRGRSTCHSMASRRQSSGK
jgi:oligopeptide transport system substrate-binding protein